MSRLDSTVSSPDTETAPNRPATEPAKPSPPYLTRERWDELFADMAAINRLSLSLHTHFENLPNADQAGVLDQAEGFAISRALWRLTGGLLDRIDDYYETQWRPEEAA